MKSIQCRYTMKWIKDIKEALTIAAVNWMRCDECCPVARARARHRCVSARSGRAPRLLLATVGTSARNAAVRLVRVGLELLHVCLVSPLPNKRLIGASLTRLTAVPASILCSHSTTWIIFSLRRIDLRNMIILALIAASLVVVCMCILLRRRSSEGKRKIVPLFLYVSNKYVPSGSVCHVIILHIQLIWNSTLDL